MKKERNLTQKPFLIRKKKTIWIGAFVLFAITLICLWINSNRQTNRQGSQIQVATVTRGSITQTIETYGAVEAKPSAVLTWNTNGVVSAFDVEIGDHVDEGAILMELESSSQEAEILDAHASLLEAQYELDLATNADSQYQDVLNDLAYQEKMLINKHADKLAWNYGRSPEKRIDAVRANYYAAREEVWDLEEAYNEVKMLDERDPERAAAYEALQKGKVKRDSLLRALNQILSIPFDIPVETDFIEYDQQAATVAEARVAYDRYVDQNNEINAAQAAVQIQQNVINQAKIIAPFSGTITSISAVPGQVVSEDTEALRLDDLDILIIAVKVSQAEINKLEVGQSTTITFDAISDKTYHGFVQSISGAGSEDDNGVVQFGIEILMVDPDELVKPGFTAVVSIITDQVENALLVPNQAITHMEDGTSIVSLVDKDGSLTMIPVASGASTDLYTEIASEDIQEGDQVAVLASTGTEFNGDIRMRGFGGGMFGGVMRSIR